MLSWSKDFFQKKLVSFTSALEEMQCAATPLHTQIDVEKIHRAHGFSFPLIAKRVCSNIVRVDRLFKSWVSEESHLFRGGVVFRKLNMFHDWAVQEMYNCFTSRWFSLPECLLPESVGPNVLYHQQSKRVALDDMTKCTLCYQDKMPTSACCYPFMVCIWASC